MTNDVEWLGVIERQQQEIELLRQELAATGSNASSYCSERCGSDASSVASLAFSVLSMRDDASEFVDSYANMCEKMERMRAALVRKDAKLRKVRAQYRVGQEENARLRAAVTKMRSETEMHVASQDKAVEKAAQALMKSDALSAELSKLREVEALLSQDLRVAERARDDVQKHLDGAHQEVSRLAMDVRILKGDKSSLQSELHDLQQELKVKRKNESEWNELSTQKNMIQQRMREMENIVKSQKAQLLQQTTLIDQQTQQIQHLKGEQGVTKQMVTSRNREVSLGRALREYGKRNRDLQASVVAARQKFHIVVSAFRGSEKRKVQAISANCDLKRDLVIERCQRTDLIRQCKELENCLDSCQSSASETQTRAEGLERDNDVLHYAVTQLVAYAKELMSSQQSLQRELTKLEITGRRQPAVYG
ncbi:Dynactin [Phytophthora palmivora]|uniref:Dynactin n=2 Tax=Phytophthora palmivora TaxID=4796 RepID=A0A2P4Y5G4_9STRA|nr:Dynactin [Phytophthora palmivora]